jgi:uncharacterized phage protein (TIGR01671 family)
MITKYRAFDKITNKIYDVYQLFPQNTDSGAVKLAKYTDDYSKNIWQSIGNVILLQFINVFDKNKNELYTGDIVKYQGRNYEIYFDEKYGCYALKTNRYGKIEPLGHGGSSTKYSPYLWNWLSKKVEKVGNVFENEDLLK